MKKVLCSIFLSTFIIINSFAQDTETYAISGKIIDSLSNQPLEYSTISLTNNSTKELTGTISDKNGYFKINTNPGEYTLIIKFFSYNDIIKPNLNIDKNINIGDIILSPKAESLNTIEVSGKTKITSIKLGKTVYNIELDISAQGGTINDILSSTPSVSVINGVPTIRGSTATVLINGRVTSMSKTEALENLQASLIKKIEIITVPTSKNRADSSGGIINIILKKGLDKGWNGSVTATAGIKNVYGGAATLNYRKHKFNFYSNTSYFQRERIGSSTIKNEYFLNGITDEYLTENLINKRKTDVVNTIVGIDYYMNDNSSLHVQGELAAFDGTIDRKNKYNFSNSFNNLTNSIDQFTYTDHLNDIYEFSTSYNNYFDGEGKNLTLHLRYQVDKEYNDGDVFFYELYPNQGSLSEEDELFYDNLDFKKVTFTASYAFPFAKNSSLEIGTAIDHGQLIYDYGNKVILNGDFVTNPLNTDKITYDEDVVGFYAEYESGNDTFSYKLGLRSESTNLTINFLTSQIIKTKNYTDLFPSAIFEYTFNENKRLELYYGRGIERASYGYLYPFEQRVSETTSEKGNIELLPYYSNSVELSLLKSNEDHKFTIKPSFYFRNYDEIWQLITIETGEIINNVPKLMTTPINLGYLNFTGIELIASYDPTEKINLTGSLDGTYVRQSGSYKYIDSNNETVILDYGNNSFGGSATFKANFNIGNDYHFQTNFNSFFSTQGSYSKRYSYGFMNASSSKDILRNAGSLTISANDIFNLNKTKRLRWTDNVNSLRTSQWKEPSILVTFTYRFNQSKKDNVIDINKKDSKKYN